MATPKGKGGTPGKPSVGGMSLGERELVEQARQSAGIGGDRPRKNPGSLGNNNDNDERDPTRNTGIGLLDAADKAIQDALSGTPGDDRISSPTERADVRPPNDEERPPLRPPSEEEEPAIIPGDPSNLGARGRRRRGQNDSNASPVLRRGLLGV